MNPHGDLIKDGYCVISDAFDLTAIAAMRLANTENLDTMANTRPNPASRHLAGFHRFAAFEPLHWDLICNDKLTTALTRHFAPAKFDPIGLGDITVNRSQDWHTDLLRGTYAPLLTPEICWGARGGGCVKALLYLQNGRSLQVLPGSHLVAVSLTDDTACEPGPGQTPLAVEAQRGDIILIDIRLKHRGSTEQQMQDTDRANAAKILISTVFGSRASSLSRIMRVGNAHRMKDWDSRHLSPNRLKELA